MKTYLLRCWNSTLFQKFFLSYIWCQESPEKWSEGLKTQASSHLKKGFAFNLRVQFKVESKIMLERLN